MIPISNIQKITSRNIGGLARAQIIFERDILSIPEHSFGSIYLQGNIILQENARAYYVSFTKKTSSFKEDSNLTNTAGDYYTQRISFKSPKDRPVLRHLVHRLKNNRVTLVYQDRNGYFKIVRNLRCKTSTGTGNFQSYNGVTFNFTGKSIQQSGFWQYEPNPYIPETIRSIVETVPGITPPTGSGTDTNFANTDLTFLENRVHDLENHILSLIGDGKLVIGGLDGQSKLTVLQGDIEIGDEGFGLIFKRGDDRWKFTVSEHGAVQTQKL